MQLSQTLRPHSDGLAKLGINALFMRVYELISTRKKPIDFHLIIRPSDGTIWKRSSSKGDNTVI